MIPGLSLIENYLTSGQAEKLLSQIASSEKSGARNIKRWGSKRPYFSNIISTEIPEYLQELCEKLHSEKLTASVPDSVTINEYYESQGIPWHKDSPASGDTIIVISLLSDAVMGFKKTEEKQILLPKDSLLKLTLEARWEWQHCIYPVREKRFSIVFRKSPF